MHSKKYSNMLQSKDIPYFEETQKRTFFQKLRKIKNTILLLLAYTFPSSSVRVRLHKCRGVHIGSSVYIGLFCFIDNLYPEYIYIEDNVGINTGSMILAHFNPGKRFKRVLKSQVEPVLIKTGAMIAVKSIIMPGVIIGENAIVAAGSVVYENVEDYTLYRGNPAKKVGKIKI